MTRCECPETDAGRRLLRMFETTEGPRHTRWPRAFDARLAERIVEEFVPMIERDAVADHDCYTAAEDQAASPRTDL